VLIYLPYHEGRGIGLFKKIRAYALQDQGLDTVDANLEQGAPIDARDYEFAAQILTDLGFNKIRLMTNNPAKVDALKEHGIEVVEQISAAAVDADGRIVDRVEIKSLTIRDTPPPEPVPFSTQTPTELAAYRAVLETSLGEIGIELFPDRAPNHVRNFLRLAQAGVFDGMAFHRVVN
jgi:hypothetical protein